MVYNGLGERVQMTGWAEGQSAVTSYALDLASPKAGPLAATSLNNATFYLYGRGKPVGEQVVGWSYYLNDGLSVPRQMSDATGMVTLTREYTPWGEVLKQAGMGNFTDGSLSRGYFGGLMDAATGLLYVGGGQYYDPATGRFLTPANRSGNPYLPGRIDQTAGLLGSATLLALVFRRRRKPGKYDTLVVTLVLAFGLGIGLVACGGTSTPTNTCTPPSLPPTGTAVPTTEATRTPQPTEELTPTPSGKTAYLTFDDGPEYAGTTQAIALYLNQQGVRATFFVNAKDDGVYLSAILAIEGAGHAIGLHGWTHPEAGDNSPHYWNHRYFNVSQDITREKDAVEALLGHPLDPLLLRAGGGNFASSHAFRDSKKWAPYQGAYFYGWDINPGDGMYDPADLFIEKMRGALEDAKNGGRLDQAIILLHSNREGTHDAVVNGQLLSLLVEYGYGQFMALPRSLADSGYPPKGIIAPIGDDYPDEYEDDGITLIPYP